MNRFAQAISNSFSVLSKLVVPLYTDDESGTPRLLGSGLFITNRGSTLLVSAAHVLEEGKSSQLYFFMADVGAGVDPPLFAGEVAVLH